MLLSDNDAEYTAHTHAVACLSGAVGLLHRSFWSDLPLCLTDRFAGYLSHLQYRLLRSPSTKLVMDLLQVQEELAIIIKIMQQQIDLLEQIQTEWNSDGVDTVSRAQSRSSSVPARRLSVSKFTHQAALRQYSTSTLTDPMQQVLENLRRELVDFSELKENSNNLINRTIQLVNIKLEDHSKAILVLTVTAVVFMPLSFISSYFGMNFTDIRNTTRTQGLFWTISCSLTVGVVFFTLFIAFWGGDILEAFFTWQANRMARRKTNFKKLTYKADRNLPTGIRNFEVLGVS
jgi:Mg2+ and Co2+ transporter CorA